jgi:hypothetical protein
MTHGILRVHPKVNSVFWRRKFKFAVFISGNMLLMKYSWLNLLPLRRISNTISFLAVKNTVNIVFSRQLPAASSEWHLLPNGQAPSMMPWCVKTRTCSFLQCDQNHSLLTLAKSLTFFCWLNTRDFLSITQRMRDRAPREFSHPQFSLKNFFDSGSSHQEVFCDYPGTCERILLAKCLNLHLRSESEGWSSSTRKVTAWKIPGSEPLQPDFDLGIP